VVESEFEFVLGFPHLLVVFVIIAHLFLVDEWLLAQCLFYVINCLFESVVNYLFVFMGLSVVLHLNEVAQCSLHLVVWMIRKG